MIKSWEQNQGYRVNVKLKQQTSGMTRVNEGSHILPASQTFSTSGVNHTCLYSPATENHRPMAGTHFTVSQRVEGWVDLVGWLYTEIKCRPRESSSDTVINPSTNRAKRTLTSFINICTTRRHFLLFRWLNFSCSIHTEQAAILSLAAILVFI